MNRIAEELDAKLNTLDPEKAKELVQIVQHAIERIEGSTPDWPEGYFSNTSGSFADEILERDPQGKAAKREDW